MTTLTINLTDIEELRDVQTLIQFQIDKLHKAEEEWKNERKLKKKKKTVEQIIEEINEDIQYETDSIIDSNIEIQNLELKRQEVEKMDKEFVSPPILKKIKKILKIKKKDTVLI